VKFPTQYSYILFAANLNSLHSRRHDLKSFFQEICNPSFCIHHLLPPSHDTSVLSSLRTVLWLFGTSSQLWLYSYVLPMYSNPVVVTCCIIRLRLPLLLDESPDWLCGLLQSFITDRAARLWTASIWLMLLAVCGAQTVEAYSSWGRTKEVYAVAFTFRGQLLVLRWINVRVELAFCRCYHSIH